MLPVNKLPKVLFTKFDGTGHSESSSQFPPLVDLYYELINMLSSNYKEMCLALLKSSILMGLILILTSQSQLFVGWAHTVQSTNTEVFYVFTSDYYSLYICYVFDLC